MRSQFTSKSKQASQHQSFPPRKKTIQQFTPVHPILQLQQTHGNQGILRLLESGRFRVSQPGDRYEQEADRVAEQILQMREPSESEPASTLSKTTDSNSSSARHHSSAGKALDPDVQQFFEARFGHSFANVRVHRERMAGESAHHLNSQAYTIGNNITFAPGEYQPWTTEGKRLLAHELAHVVQQTAISGQTRSHSPAATLSHVPSHLVQRKLLATGDARGFAALANSVIGVQYEVVVSASGEVSLRSTNVQGPLTSAAQELVSVLRTVISDSNATMIEFTHGERNVIVGSYLLSKIDLDDISAFGLPTGRGLSAGTALAHEILEQYRKQVHREAYPVAHAAGLASEARAAGATITPGPLRQVSPGTVEIKDIYTYPDGTREEVTIEVTDGNVTNVTRRNLP